MRAFLKTSREYPRLRNFFVVFVLALGLIWTLTIWETMHPSPHETLEQAQAYQAADAAQQAADAAAAGRRARVCHVRTVCSNYGRARQECAAAGNFGLCIDVKVGHQDFSPASVCTDDGGVLNPPPDMPSVADCALSVIENFLVGQ